MSISEYIRTRFILVLTIFNVAFVSTTMSPLNLIWTHLSQITQLCGRCRAEEATAKLAYCDSFLSSDNVILSSTRTKEGRRNNYYIYNCKTHAPNLAGRLQPEFAVTSFSWMAQNVLTQTVIDIPVSRNRLSVLKRRGGKVARFCSCLQVLLFLLNFWEGLQCRLLLCVVVASVALYPWLLLLRCSKREVTFLRPIFLACECNSSPYPASALHTTSLA